jgi:hypothetical protein
VHSANCVKTCTLAYRRVLNSAPLYLTGSRSLVDFGNKTHKLNLKNYNYTRNLDGRSFGRCVRNRPLSESSMKFTNKLFGCALRNKGRTPMTCCAVPRWNRLKPLWPAGGGGEADDPHAQFKAWQRRTDEWTTIMETLNNLNL